MRKKSTASTRNGNRPSPIRRRKVRHLLVPTDFSAAARRAVRYAEPMARRFRAEMVLLHVVPPLTYAADYGYGPVVRRIADEEEVLLANRRLQSVARGRRCMVRTGYAAEEIVRAARDLKSELIVMGEGSMGSEGAEKTIAEKTLHDAPCPVLIVRESGAELLKPRKD